MPGTVVSAYKAVNQIIIPALMELTFYEKDTWEAR